MNEVQLTPETPDDDAFDLSATPPYLPPCNPALAIAFALQLIMASSVQDCGAGPKDKPSVQFLIISGSSWAGTNAMSNLLRRLEDPHQASQQQRQANKATCVAHTDWGRQRGRCFGLMITIKQRAQRRASMSRVGPVCASVSAYVCVCLCLCMLCLRWQPATFAVPHEENLQICWACVSPSCRFEKLRQQREP